MSERRVIIIGGGIGGLALGLTLHQIGVRCSIYESVRNLKPLGVGINLQPNAVRELYELGIGAEILDTVGLPVKEWALVGMQGQDIYSEPRGSFAGYNWPQYAVHRGEFHMALYHRFLDVVGADAFHSGHRAKSYRIEEAGKASVTFENSTGTVIETADLVIAADGIHSAIRAQMYPDQPPIHWGGVLMWRGTSWAKPVHFEDWKYDWLDVPALIRGSDIAYENPMIDRDPIPSWVDGPVALLGDAAHAMYPTGSNGATQAIIDARILGAKFLEFGVNPDALAAYNAELRDPISSLVLRNRDAGPFGLLNMVNDRCGGDFKNINDIVSEEERNDFMAKYKSAAGFARDALNNAPPLIAAGAKIRS
ncbi:MAG: flavin-dependent oxidoreductase [Rhodobacteraceae bacterium]|nr:flavin-dependent oxidoreductase [Paracoccaceae bacterium]